MILEIFQLRHLEEMNLQDAQREDAKSEPPEYWAAVDEKCESYTIRAQDNRILACIGVMIMWERFGQIWCRIDRDAGKSMVQLVRSMEYLIQAYEHRLRRFETVVEDGFGPGHRLMRILGFKCETPDGMEYYLPSGKKAYLYSRINHG